MSVDISTELAAILAAIYGEEVRGSIHDALLKMNNNLNTAIGNQLLTIDDTLTATDPHAAADSKKVGDVIQTISGLVAFNYNPASSYAVGDYCSYGYSPTTVGHIYRCTTAINGGEAWNPDHWQSIEFANRIGEIIQYLFNKIATIYDPTHAYAVGDFCTYGNNKSDPGRIYRCNTAIGSGGEAWNASHWTLVDLADVIADADDKIADLLKYNSSDILKNGTRNNRVTGGVTFTWNDDGSCTVTGTNTSNVICNMHNGALPAWIEAGKSYYIKHDSESVNFRLFDTTNSTSVLLIGGMHIDEEVTIPESCQRVLIQLQAVPGTHNEIINPVMLTAETNLALTKLTQNNMNRIADVETSIEDFINLDIQTAVLHSQDIYIETDGSNLYLYFGGLVCRSRISVIKDLASIGEDVALVTSPLGRTNCIAIPYGKSLIYRVTTNKIEIVNNKFSGKDSILLAYITSNGKLAAGHFYTQLIEQKLNEEDGSDVIPVYFSAVIPVKLQTITNNMAIAGRHGFSIIHITDTHVTKNSHNSEILISNILKNSRVKYLLHNGDIVGSYTDSQQSCMDTLRKHISGFELHGKRMFVNIGNHDYNYVNNNVQHPERIITQDQIYAAIMADMQEVVYYQPGKYHWYYVDEPSSTALIGFQTGYNYSTFGVLAEDLPPLKALLDSLTVDNVIISAHQIFSQNPDTELYTSLNNNNYSQIRATIDASVNASKVKCILTGHNHYDYSVVDNGLLVVSTTTDSYIQDSSYAGTTDELAFDVCTFDWSANKLYMTRIGRGSDRVITLG